MCLPGADLNNLTEPSSPLRLPITPLTHGRGAGARIWMLALVCPWVCVCIRVCVQERDSRKAAVGQNLVIVAVIAPIV